MNRRVIASAHAPTYHGGLAAYERALASALGPGQGVFLSTPEALPGFAGDDAPLPWPLLEMKPRTPFYETAPLWPRLASRPATHPVLEALASRAWRFPAGLPTPRVVHLVDTGWRFSSFAIAHWARRNGARFTIWPAVHPGQWGDDVVDLRLYRMADVVFCQSQAEAAHLVARGLEPARICLCGLPPMTPTDGDAARFRRAHALGDRPVVFFLGRRTLGKGYPLLLAAWQKVLKTVPEAILVLAGGGGEEDPPSASLFPPDSWRNLGPLDDLEKQDAFAACTLFCLPSAHEAFGIVYVEAWAYGKPVICGTSPASRELVANGQTGLWAEPDAAGLAQQITHLLRHPQEAHRLGEAGRALQQQRYTREAFVQTHRQAWGEVP